MIAHDGMYYFSLPMVLMMAVGCAIIVWLALNAISWKLKVIQPFLILLTVYRLEDVRPLKGGCTQADISNSAGGAIGFAMFGELSNLLDWLVEDKSLHYDRETKSYSLLPRGRNVLEYGFPETRPANTQRKEDPSESPDD